MTTVEALLEARKELETAYRKDVDAIEYLLTRMGYRRPDDAVTYNGLGQPRVIRIPDVSAKEGSLRDWVVKAATSQLSEGLSAPFVYEYAIMEGAKFNSERDKTIQAIGGVLRRMAEEGVIRVVLQGAGRRASTYEWQTSVPEKEQEETPA